MRRATSVRLVLLASIVVSGVVSGGVASAQRAQKQKAAPNKYVKAAGEAFNAALAADTANDLPTAYGLYTKAFQISPHPATAYNLADVERRRGNIDKAIEYFEVYLLLAPQAADAADVRKTIAALEATPSVIELQSEPPSNPDSIELTPTYILFDGQIVKKPGVPGAIDPRTATPKLDLPGPGRNFHATVVSEITAGHMDCNGLPGTKSTCRVLAPPRTDGNVVASSQHGRNVQILTLKGEDVTNKRFVSPPGKQTLILRERSIDCRRMTIDVPANGDVLFIFVGGEPTRYPTRCRKLDVVQRRLTF